jgi:hypothetical protein
LKARYGTTPTLAAAFLFFCAAVSISSTFFAIPDMPFPGRTSSWERPVEVFAEASPLVFLCASILVFRHRLGYGLGLIAGLIALPWFVRTELSLAPWNSWVFLNYESPMSSGGGLVLVFTKLKILSAGLIVLGIVCASIRLFPDRWSLRGVPLCRRTWPAFVVGLFVLVGWFVYSVMPYSVPGFDHPAGAELRILRVQKHGLRFHESTMVVSRNGRVWVLRGERRLFQYRFVLRVAMTALEAPAYQRALVLVQSPELWKLRTPRPRALRSWNAEAGTLYSRTHVSLRSQASTERRPQRRSRTFFTRLRNSRSPRSACLLFGTCAWVSVTTLWLRSASLSCNSAQGCSVAVRLRRRQAGGEQQVRQP